jgi:hypothetical protein
VIRIALAHKLLVKLNAPARDALDKTDSRSGMTAFALFGGRQRRGNATKEKSRHLASLGMILEAVHGSLIEIIDWVRIA